MTVVIEMLADDGDLKLLLSFANNLDFGIKRLIILEEMANLKEWM